MADPLNTFKSFNRNLNKFKSGFFDRVAVQRIVDEARLKGLNKFGALVRTIAMRSMRKRKKSSAPGQPPSVHRGDLKRLLFYSYDTLTRSVVAGPVAFNPGRWKRPINATVPQVLEGGGRIAVREVQLSGGKWVRATKRLANKHRPERSRIIPIHPHPYMNPALEKALPKFPGFFSNRTR